jgi:putative transposase
MKKVNLAYYYFFKRKYDWVGHLWQGRFKSRPVGKDQYFIQCGKYIELNPVKAGLVSDPGAYTFSSYRHYTEGFKDKLITDDFIYLSLGKDSQERGIKYHELVIDQVIESTYIKNVWGSSEQIRREKQKINSKFNPSRLKK